MLFLWLVVMQLAIFAALAFLLRVILTRNITSATTHLHQLSEGYTQKLEDAKKRQAEAEKYYDQTILKSKLDAEKTKVQILKEAHEAEEALLKEARLQSEDIIAQANKAGESLLREVEVRIDARALDKAMELTRVLFSQEINKEMHVHWIEELLKSGLDNLERLNLPAEVREAEIVSAYTLGPEQKAALQKKIEDKLKRKIHLHDKTDGSLIAGFQMKLDTVMIDGSLKSRIKEVAKDVKRNHTQ